MSKNSLFEANFSQLKVSILISLREEPNNFESVTSRKFSNPRVKVLKLLKELKEAFKTSAAS